MQNIVETDVTLAFKELTDDLKQIIGEEVHNLFNRLKQKGEDVRDTGHFKNSIKAPTSSNKGWNWQIQLKAKYSSILWGGRDKIGDRHYGSVKWYNGGQPMLEKMGNDIELRAKNVTK